MEGHSRFEWLTRFQLQHVPTAAVIQQQLLTGMAAPLGVALVRLLDRVSLLDVRKEIDLGNRFLWPTMMTEISRRDDHRSIDSSMYLVQLDRYSFPMVFSLSRYRITVRVDEDG